MAELSKPKLSYRTVDGDECIVPLDRVRTRDLATAAPWRTLRSYRGQLHYSGMYWSATTGNHVIYESRLELARLLLADFDPAVVSILAQPFQLSVQVDGRTSRHVPDLLLLDRSGLAHVVDVKPVNLLDEQTIARALAWAGQLIQAHGWRFEVWSGCDGVLLANLRFLAGYRRPSLFNQSLIGEVLGGVDDGDTIATVERRLVARQPAHVVRPALLHLVWRGDISADLHQVLSGATTLRLTRDRAA